MRQPPLEESRLDPRDNMEEFTPVGEEEVRSFAGEADRLARTTDKALYAGFCFSSFGDIALVPAPWLKQPKGIRDIEEWYISLLTRSGYVHRVFAAQTEIALANLEKVRARVGDRVQAVFICGTDFGTQTSTFCSVEAFRSLFLPYYKKVNDWIHARTPWKTFKHSCGAVRSLLPSFIDAGFDIWNPVQFSAAGLDPVAIKREFGRDLVFWGGGVDTQKTLPFGTPAEVREEVLRRCEVLAKGGGFVFNAVHNVQGNTPTANVVAMIEAVREFNGRK